MKIAYKVLHIVTRVFASVVFYAALIVFIALLVPRAFGIQPSVVLSDSMAPTFRAGSLCYINTRTAYDDLQIGDTACRLVIGSNGKTERMVHRIIEKDENGLFVTKGDNNDFKDGAFGPNLLCGKVVFTIPKVGEWVKTVQEERRPKIIIGTIAVLSIFIGLLDFSPKPEDADTPPTDTVPQ